MCVVADVGIDKAGLEGLDWLDVGAALLCLTYRAHAVHVLRELEKVDAAALRWGNLRYSWGHPAGSEVPARVITCTGCRCVSSHLRKVPDGARLLGFM